MKEVFEGFFKFNADADIQLLKRYEDRQTQIQKLLTELFRTELVTVECLFNTRICKVLTFVKDFCTKFKELDLEADNSCHAKLKAIFDRLSM